MRDCLTVAIRRTTWKWSPKQKPPWFPTGVLIKAGDDLLSRYSHYHGPQVLNGRVRNGNGCGHLGMVTVETHGILARSASKGLLSPLLALRANSAEYQKGSGGVDFVSDPYIFML